MSATRNNTAPPSCNLLRLSDDHEIAIYLRNGAAWVAEFKNGHSAIDSATAWFSTHGRTLVHAQRRGDVSYVSPIPQDVLAHIECLHLGMEKPNTVPVIRRTLAILAGELRAMLTAVHSLSSRRG
jgi:hypothetical protein